MSKTVWFVVIMLPILSLGTILAARGYKIHFFQDEPAGFRYISAGNIYFNMSKYCESIVDLNEKAACIVERDRFMDNRWSKRR